MFCLEITKLGLIELTSAWNSHIVLLQTLQTGNSTALPRRTFSYFEIKNNYSQLTFNYFDWRDVLHWLIIHTEFKYRFEICHVPPTWGKEGEPSHLITDGPAVTLTLLGHSIHPLILNHFVIFDFLRRLPKVEDSDNHIWRKCYLSFVCTLFFPTNRCDFCFV